MGLWRVGVKVSPMPATIQQNENCMVPVLLHGLSQPVAFHLLLQQPHKEVAGLVEASELVGDGR